MTDVIDPAPPVRPAAAISSVALPSVAIDAPRAVFWGAIAIAAGSAGVALTAGASVGVLGAILLLSLAGVALVFLVWLSRGQGRFAGLFPDRGAMEAVSAELSRGQFAALDALDEPALVADRQGGALAANAAYRALVEGMGLMGESRRPPSPERLFGADPAMGPPMFRLARAAGSGQRRREDLPAVAFVPGHDPQRFEASVAPMPGGRVLWRLRPVSSSGGAPSGDMEARRMFLEEAPVGFAAVRPDGGVIYANAALRTALGLGDQSGDLKLRDLLKDDPARVLRRDRRGLGLSRLPVTLRSRDGSEVRALALTFWPAGEPDGGPRIFALLGEAADLVPSSTPRSEVSAGSDAATDAVASSFFEHAPFGAALVDGGDPAAATLLDANPALMAMAQGAASPGGAFIDLFDASEGSAALVDRLRRAASGDMAELTLASHPPTAVHVHFVRLGNGRGLAYVVDVGQQRDLETRLAQSEKMREIGLLAGGVAHDFNNLLHVMIQRTHTLRLRHPVGDPDNHDLSIIHDHVMRAKELSEMLRAYARQQTFKLEIFEAPLFVQQMHELARRLCGDGIKCQVQHEPNLPFVKADKSQLERVLINLISNARDAMTPKDAGIPKAGTLTLRTRLVGAADVRSFGRVPVEDGDYVAIEVSDTGVGIKPEDQHKIFHPFHSTKDPTKGTGLGLATSYGIVKQSGGYIFFSSKPNKGTTFSIFLPAYAPSAQEIDDMARREREAMHRPALDVAGRGRILFVEDDDFVRESTAANLKQFGYEIIEAESGIDALDMLKADPGSFDMVITDVSMPGMSGVEMIKTAGRDLLGRAPVLFMTGYSAENTLPAGDGMSYISKPVDATDLARKVKEMLSP